MTNSVARTNWIILTGCERRLWLRLSIIQGPWAALLSNHRDRSKRMYGNTITSTVLQSARADAVMMAFRSQKSGRQQVG